MTQLDTREITQKQQDTWTKDLRNMGLTPVPVLKPNEKLQDTILIENKDETIPPIIFDVIYWRRGIKVLNITRIPENKCLFQAPYYNVVPAKELRRRIRERKHKEKTIQI